MSFGFKFLKDKDLTLYLDFVKTLRNNPDVINPEKLIKNIAKRLKIKQITDFGGK